MRAIKVLHKILLKSVPMMHSERRQALLCAVESLLLGAFLTVTALGRGLNRPAYAKHNIKCVDRLLSNPHLHRERHLIYRALCHTLCASVSQPILLVDWTDIVEQDRLMLIRAALVLDGRAIPVFESMYPLKKYNTPRTHRQFLRELKALLPEHRKANRSVLHYAKHSNSDVFEKQQTDPWLIATNLSPEAVSPKRIMRLYGKRMQIEEGFRDLKSDKFGFGLTLSRSRNIERLNSLLLIAALATLCLWWVGLYAQQQGWQRHFQANTVTDRKVLSIPFLALQVLQRPDYPIMLYDLESIFYALIALVKQCNEG